MRKGVTLGLPFQNSKEIYKQLVKKFGNTGSAVVLFSKVLNETK